MAKSSVPKESLDQKVITCILYHDQKRDIKNLIEILSQNELTDILIILDAPDYSTLDNLDLINNIIYDIITKTSFWVHKKSFI